MWNNTWLINYQAFVESLSQAKYFAIIGQVRQEGILKFNEKPLEPLFILEWSTGIMKWTFGLQSVPTWYRAIGEQYAGYRLEGLDDRKRAISQDWGHFQFWAKKWARNRADEIDEVSLSSYGSLTLNLNTLCSWCKYTRPWWIEMLAGWPLKSRMGMAASTVHHGPARPLPRALVLGNCQKAGSQSRTGGPRDLGNLQVTCSHPW